MKTGLVMEGGGMRGLYTAGVIDVMMENQLNFDGAIGVSAGAVFGCNYKSKQIGRVIRYNKRFCKDPRYMSIRSWLTTGNIYNKDFAYHEVPTIHDPFDQATFSSNPMEFYLVCTDVHTGKPIYHLCEKGDYKDIEWMRASSAIPAFSRVIHIDGFDMLDGGVSDSIPLLWFRKKGYKKNVVILTRPEDYRKEKNKMLPLLKIILRKYPAMIKALEVRHKMYNRTLEYIQKKEQDGDTFVIRPSSPIITSVLEKDPEHLEEIYQLGRKDAEKCLEALKSFLEKDIEFQGKGQD